MLQGFADGLSVLSVCLPALAESSRPPGDPFGHFPACRSALSPCIFLLSSQPPGAHSGEKLHDKESPLVRKPFPFINILSLFDSRTDKSFRCHSQEKDVKRAPPQSANFSRVPNLELPEGTLPLLN
jgi:hypothetical protein